MSRRTPYRSREFLSFAKALGGACCVCHYVDNEQTPAAELHHYGPKGMGQKSSDLLVARVCHRHHEKIQGKRRIGFERAGEINILEALEADNVALLAAYVASLEGK